MTEHMRCQIDTTYKDALGGQAVSWRSRPGDLHVNINKICKGPEKDNGDIRSIEIAVMHMEGVKTTEA